MTELEKLKRQRAEIDKKIKALTCPTYTDGDTDDEVRLVKLFANTRRGEPTGRWTLTIKEVGRQHWDNRADTNKVIINADSKEDAIEDLESLIYSLTTVYHKARGEHWDGHDWVEDDT